MEWITSIKLWIVTLLSALATFINPISGDLGSMMALLAANFLFGLIADICVGNGWRATKMWKAFKEVVLFAALLFFIYGIGTLKGNLEESQYVVSFAVYSLIYFYATNICRNGCIIFPNGTTAHAVFKWFYWILSVEFIRRMPYLKDYMENKKTTEVIHKDETSCQDLD